MLYTTLFWYRYCFFEIQRLKICSALSPQCNIKTAASVTWYRHILERIYWIHEAKVAAEWIEAATACISLVHSGSNDFWRWLAPRCCELNWLPGQTIYCTHAHLCNMHLLHVKYISRLMLVSLPLLVWAKAATVGEMVCSQDEGTPLLICSSAHLLICSLSHKKMIFHKGTVWTVPSFSLPLWHTVTLWH